MIMAIMLLQQTVHTILDLKVIFFFRCYIKSAVVVFWYNLAEEQNCRLAGTSQGFFFLQSVVKNELFNSKQAFSWPFVRFDLGTRSLHECLYCHVMFSQRVNY